MQDAIVYLVDDDPAVRRGLERLIATAGFSVRALSTAREFLSLLSPDVPACLVVDLRMPEVDGLELQAELARRGRTIPLVFISGHATVPDSVRAMKAGAVDFLSKPVPGDLLLDVIGRAIARDRTHRAEQARHVQVQERYALLTARERQVFAMLVRGLPNKQIGQAMGIVEKTVKVHRGRVMRKMRAESLPDLVWSATLLPAFLRTGETPHPAPRGGVGLSQVP